MENEKIKVSKDILFYAFRYSLPRLSYSVSIITEEVKANIEHFKTEELSQMLLEIGEVRKFKTLLPEWREFEGLLVREIATRRMEKKI